MSNENETEPKVERVLFLYRERALCPTHEEWKRALGALEQHEYNVYTPDEGAKLQVVREWLEGCIKASEPDERDCPFGAEEMGEFLDELRMCYAGWADDRALAAAYKVARAEQAKHAWRPTGEEREKRTDEMAVFFGCFPTNEGWRHTGEKWVKAEVAVPVASNEDEDLPEEGVGKILIHLARALSYPGGPATSACGETAPVGERWGLADRVEVVNCPTCLRPAPGTVRMD